MTGTALVSGPKAFEAKMSEPKSMVQALLILLVASAGPGVLHLTLSADVVPEMFRAGLVAVLFAPLIIVMLSLRELPGMTACALGAAANAIALIANGGAMPVWRPIVVALGLDPSALSTNGYTLLSWPINAGFFARGGPLADCIPVPLPVGYEFLSVGDLLLCGGMVYFIITLLIRSRRWAA